jgi:hypothetical protein
MVPFDNGLQRRCEDVTLAARIPGGDRDFDASVVAIGEDTESGQDGGTQEGQEHDPQRVGVVAVHCPQFGVIILVSVPRSADREQKATWLRHSLEDVGEH